MRGYGLSLAGFLHHEQLRQDGRRLQVDGEGPQDLHQTKFVVEHKGQDCSRTKQKLNPKSVMVRVIGGLKLQVHQVDSAEGRGQEEDLHDGVVQRDVVGEQVQVARGEYHCEQDL